LKDNNLLKLRNSAEKFTLYLSWWSSREGREDKEVVTKYNGSKEIGGKREGEEE